MSAANRVTLKERQDKGLHDNLLARINRAFPCLVRFAGTQRDLIQQTEPF
jgi:hypothetical protein